MRPPPLELAGAAASTIITALYHAAPLPTVPPAQAEPAAGPKTQLAEGMAKRLQQLQLAASGIPQATEGAGAARPSAAWNNVGHGSKAAILRRMRQLVPLAHRGGTAANQSSACTATRNHGSPDSVPAAARRGCVAPEQGTSGEVVAMQTQACTQPTRCLGAERLPDGGYRPCPVPSRRVTFDVPDD